MTERDRLVELIGSKVCEDYSPNCDEWQPHSCEKCYANDCRIGDLADYLLANGVTVLPCKAGDVVWINNKYGTIKSKVSNITLIEDNRFLVKIHYDVRYCYDNHIETLGYVGYTEENFEFGKNVFLTKEEAEAALKGGAE